MAVIFKITDDNRAFEIAFSQEDKIATIFIGEELDAETWTSINIDKEGAIELIRYLQKIVRKMD